MTHTNSTPANPVQVTDAMVEAFQRESGRFRYLDERSRIRHALTAAIGAGGQAVAAEELHRYIAKCNELAANGEYAWWSRLAEILSALANNKPVGDGYVLVPKEPTEEMIDAGDRVMYGRYGCSFEVAPIYEAMLAASGESGR